MNTGWICYKICDKSGNTTPKYVYYGEYLDENDNESIKDWIIHIHESWAIYAEYYHLTFEINVIPPIGCINVKIVEFKKELKSINDQLDILSNQLNTLYNT